MVTALGHLLPEVRKAALLSTRHRLQQLEGDIWIGYGRAQAALARLEALLEHPSRVRMPNLLIVGPTNNGKTMLVERLYRLHPPNPGSATRPASMPVVLFQMPPDPSGQRFYAVLLAAIGGLASVRVPIAQLEHLAMTILHRIGARLLVIDEVHNLLTGNTTRQRELLGLLRFLGNELRLPLVCVGTKDAYLAIRTDEQLENRFEPLLLPLWQDDDEFGRLLASFEAVLPLREPSGLATPPLRRRILERSEGVLGEVATLLREAARVALLEGRERIDLSLLEALPYRSPAERRRLFGSMLR